MRNEAVVFLAGLIVSIGLAGTSHAAQIDDDTKARQGVVRCGGNSLLRLGGAEVHFISYTLRNLSSATPITIDRITFFDATGSVLFDSDTSGFPTFANGVLGSSDNVLDPNQSAQLDTLDVPLPFLLQTQRPIQLEIVWSAPERVLTLEVSGSRIGRERDPGTGAQLAERTRGSIGCRTIDLRRGN
jgi:hypothetical protein